MTNNFGTEWEKTAPRFNGEYAYAEIEVCDDSTAFIEFFDDEGSVLGRRHMEVCEKDRRIIFIVR